MVISHKYKYLFVELPHTGSTAIRRELCECYDGEPVLFRHSTYYDFLRVANSEEREYFTFGTIRNPLDIVVTRYFRYKTDHNRRYSDPMEIAKKNIVDRFIEGKQYCFVQENDADFSSFFLKFYRVPYNTWSSTSYRHFDFVIRYEDLADDFAETLKRIGIEPVRPLPVINKTRAKKDDCWLYYTPETRERAKRVFGAYLKLWGYELPAEWGELTVSKWNQFLFRFLTIFRVLYWQHVRHLVFKLRYPGRYQLSSE